MKFIKKSDVRTLIGFILILTLGLGIYSALYMTKKIERDERKNLLLRADTIATLIDEKDIFELKGSDADMASATYIDLKDKMTKLHLINTDTRFVYLMGLKDGKQFFYVDSEDPSSKDYSPPGQIYPDSEAKDFYNHEHGIAYTKGPYTDQWGRWFSAYAPVFDQNKNVIALVGMDIDAEKLLLRISIVRNATILIFGLIFVSFLIIILLTKKAIQKLESRLS